ncbi:MAG: SPOR domain-containing protein [Acidobacteria bacterium]|nr:SPOR domain-containing protein [Acidobacteriota bacterium]MBV9146969.1 SPOR domain-containing protein [Acidobacteriota bacterium]MBV9438335.1 SPOR domain-containing protein [Acidobacteriota bacterium]
MSQELEQKDTEIILGTGKLLAIFFGLTAMCGAFFGLGYSLGRSSGPMTLKTGPATVMSGPGGKPGAGVTLPAAAPDVTPPPSAVPSNTETVQTAPAPQPTADVQTAPAQATTKPADNSATTPDTAANKAATPELEGASITVQVAAVTKQEDAEALVAALRKKNYPVFVSPNASADNLYHVQVGPFSEVKDAEAMKSKLAGDGYNAIVKK